MTATIYNAHESDAEERSEGLAAKAWRLLGYAILGIVILLINAPRFLSGLIRINVHNEPLRAALQGAIDKAQAIASFAVGPSPAAFLERAMSASFVLLWVFTLALVCLAVRRRHPRMFVYGLCGIVTGYFGLHLIAWAAVIVAGAIYVALFVGHWIGIAVAAIVGFLLTKSGWFVLAAALFGAAYLFRGALVRFWLQLLRNKLIAALAAMMLAAALYLAPLFYHFVLKPLWMYLEHLFNPVVQVILFVLKWFLIIVIGALLVLTAIAISLVLLALIGSLLVSQIQAGWHAGRNARHVLVAGFAVGSAFALVLLESVATPALAEALNHAWLASLSVLHSGGLQSQTLTDMFQVFLPKEVRSFVFLHLTNADAPAFDSMVLFAILGLSVCSALSGLFRPEPSHEDVTVAFVAREYALMSVGLFVALIVVFVNAFGGDSQA